MITIHYFSRTHHDTNAVSLPLIDASYAESLSEVDIITKAQALVYDLNPDCINYNRVGGNSGNWRNVGPPEETTWSELAIIDMKRVWALRQPPPRMPYSNTTRSKKEPKAWNTSSVDAQEDELFSINDLDDFQFGNFVKLAASVAKKDQKGKQKQTHEASHYHESGIQSKRRRITANKDDYMRDAKTSSSNVLQSLYNVIPQPHFYSYPYAPPQAPTSDRDPRNNLEPWPWPDTSGYMSATAKVALSQRWKRCSWILPIRGDIFFDDNGLSCRPSKATFQDTGENKASNTDGSEIKWTANSLGLFWSFLLQVRAAGMLGAVSLSFHARDVYSLPEPGNVEKHIPSSKFVATTSNNMLLNLRESDYIKIYHDARYSLYFRRVLDAWKYVDPDFQVVKGGRKIKLRPLLSCRLTLLDELGSVLLIC